MKKIALLAALLIFLASCKQEEPYLVVLSMDAFRWDYCDIYDTPNLDKIREKGVKAEYVQCSFPTVTFPNHYSMATGLYPDHHGIVSNTFYDSTLLDTFRLSKRECVENPAFWSGEPIWVTAETQNVNSAVYFWPGSETPVKGLYADFWKKYDHLLPFEQRIDTVLHWLQLPKKIRPHLIMWYLGEPDETSHNYGPISAETGAMVHYLDSLVGTFMDRIARLPNAAKINVIITSDHGMTATAPDRVVYLADYIKPEWIERGFGHNPALLYTKPEYRQIVWDALQNIPNIKAYKKEEIPERLHYGTNSRIGDIVVIPDCGYLVAATRGQKLTFGGAHGYDNDCTDMHAIFYAYGPAFKKQYEQPYMANVDLYNLMAAILHLQPAPNDGSFDRVKKMLK